jgi:hypothetical protein
MRKLGPEGRQVSKSAPRRVSGGHPSDNGSIGSR